MICTCGRCKCDNSKNLNWRITNKQLISSYTFDYPHKKNRYVKHQRKKSQKLIRLPFNHNSSQRVHYQPPRKINDTLTNFAFDSMKWSSNFRAPFPKMSVYKETYLNWENSLPSSMIKPQNLKKIQFPFVEHVSSKVYGNFGIEKGRLESGQKFGIPQYKNPLGPMIKTEKISTTKTDFRPIKGLTKFVLKNPPNAQVPNPKFKDQFKTSSNLYGLEKQPKCKARMILDERAKATKFN